MEKALEQAAVEHEEASGRVPELKEARSRGRVRAEVLRWARETQPRYVELLRLEGEQAQAVQEANRKLGGLRERRSTATRALRGEEQAATKLARELARMRELVAGLEELSALQEAWKVDSEAAAQLEARKRSDAKRLEDLSRGESALAVAFADKSAALGGMQQEIEKIESKQSELAGWLARVEDHIRDARCPLCGHDHGSLDGLRGQVEKMRTLDGAAALRGELARLRKEREELERRWADAREQVAVQNASVEEAEKERKARESRIAAFEESVATMGLSMGEPTEAIRGIEERCAQEKRRVQEAERKSSDLQATIENSKTAIAELDGAIEPGQKALVDAERELDDCRSEIGRLRDDRRVDQVSLDTEAAQLTQASDRQMEELRRMEVAVSEAVERAGERKAAVNTLRQRVAALTNALDGLKRDVAARRRTVTETNARLAECDLGVEAGEKEVRRLLEKKTRAQDQLAELRDFADSVEVAMDTAMTAAALKHQREAIREKERLIEEAKRDIERHESWRSYLGVALLRRRPKEASASGTARAT